MKAEIGVMLSQAKEHQADHQQLGETHGTDSSLQSQQTQVSMKMQMSKRAEQEENSTLPRAMVELWDLGQTGKLMLSLVCAITLCYTASFFP